MKKLTKIALAASLLVGGIASTQACSLGAWDANATTALAGGPADAVNVFARYQGLCAMQTTGAIPQVLNNGANGAASGPAGEASMIARFYFLPGAATGPIFTTYAEDAATTAIYTVSYDGTNVTVTPNGGGAPAVVAVGGTNWHSVEVKWASGDGTNGGAIDVWVDTDATAVAADASTTSAVAATTIQAANLGGTAGMIFDAYESRRTTSVGRLIKGDSTGDGTVNIVDAIGVVGEINNTLTNVGQPDCTEDGNINIVDAICVVNIINGN